MDHIGFRIGRAGKNRRGWQDKSGVGSEHTQTVFFHALLTGWSDRCPQTICGSIFKFEEKHFLRLIPRLAESVSKKRLFAALCWLTWSGCFVFALESDCFVVQCDKLLFQNNWREFVCDVDWLLTCPLAAVGHSEKCNQEVFRLLRGGLPCPS